MSKKRRKKLYQENKKKKIVKSNITTKDKIVWIAVLTIIVVNGFCIVLEIPEILHFYLIDNT